MVVLTLKNLQQQTFTVEIELSATVKALKEKVEKEKGGDYPAVGQKLIYAGKILQDDTTLESYNIDDKKFLVIMVTKPKAPPPPVGPSDPTIVETEETPAEEPAATTESSSQSTSTPSTEPAAAAGTNTTTTTTTTSSSQSSAASNTQSTPATQAASGGSVGSAESLLVMGEEFNRMVENIMEMGYERSQVERALRASFNNPYTAVQYLVDGIPPNLEEPAAQPAQGGDGGGEEQVVAEGEADPDEDPLNFLRSQPQFEQMRQMIRSNPSLLDAFIQQIGQTNPQLLQVIQQNQEAFVRMLNEGGSSGGPPTLTSGGSTGGGSGNQGGDGSGGRAAPGQNAILVSPQDRDAIERLKALGNFPEDVVIQAYFACEKNENLAAEFLFSQTWD
ncbi:UV excision repair protein RAD23 homolog A-like isoform X1 [Penaeus japonicus]|uniref:UV excision repair protein RAD23 homolog A-like isoform X1 n=2 Tax=Penaeus japonicus TaxID=27405 RepID=UPI001C716EB5|nr:UV excision repair protein RAD23 homolog A-like isoform X1 [Penaeus japonicus]